MHGSVGVGGSSERAQLRREGKQPRRASPYVPRARTRLSARSAAGSDAEVMMVDNEVLGAAVILTDLAQTPLRPR